eukprot:Gb_00225 [translate_table: standard]
MVGEVSIRPATPCHAMPCQRGTPCHGCAIPAPPSFHPHHRARWILVTSNARLTIMPGRVGHGRPSNDLDAINLPLLKALPMNCYRAISAFGVVYAANNLQFNAIVGRIEPRPLLSIHAPAVPSSARPSPAQAGINAIAWHRVRLQLDALLAEKAWLTQENANYVRENQYLHQLVEYHQLTLQDVAI